MGRLVDLYMCIGSCAFYFLPSVSSFIEAALEKAVVKYVLDSQFLPIMHDVQLFGY